MNSSCDHNDEELSTSSKIKLYAIDILKKILIIIFIYYIEKLLYMILTYILYFSFLSISFQIFLHLLLLRYLVLKVVFAGLSFFISRNIQYKRGIIQASYILKELNNLKSSFSLLFDESKPIEEIKYFNILQRNMKSSVLVINKFWQVFHKMKEKFNSLTYDQNIFYNNISNLKILLEKSKILNFLNDVIKKLKEEKVSDIKNISTNLITQLTDYIGEDYSLYSLRYIRNYFFNILFASIQQFDVELDSYFIFEQKNLITKDEEANLDYIIIKSKLSTKNSHKKLMIICGPNAEPYQIFARNIPLNIYLNKGIDILCWNYRGYGFSTGKADFNNLKEDIIDIYTEIKNHYNYESIGVHGISLGGVPACYLAKNFFLGKYLALLYKLLLIPSSRNVENYLNAKCEKILLNDPCDEIVTEEGSLKTMISEKLISKYIYINKYLENEMIEMKNIDTVETIDTSINSNNCDDNQIEIEDDEDNNILKNKEQTNYNLISME